MPPVQSSSSLSRRFLTIVLATVLAITASVVADNTLTPAPASAAPPKDLVFTMSTVGMPYDSGKARANFKKQFGSNKVEDVIRTYAAVPATPPGTTPATPPYPYSDSNSRAWMRALIDSKVKGTVTFNPHSISVTIKRDSVQPSAWGDVLKTAAATTAIVAGSALAIFICFSTEVAGPVVCKAVAGSIGAMIARFIYAYFTGADMSSTQFWAERPRPRPLTGDCGSVENHDSTDNDDSQSG